MGASYRVERPRATRFHFCGLPSVESVCRIRRPGPMFSPIPTLICSLIEKELEAAVEGDALRLHYQPQIDLMTHRVVGYEALLHWQHPTRGLLMPGSFLPLVHGSRIMMAVTGWALHGALRDWIDRSGSRPAPPVAVNICASSIDDMSCPRKTKPFARRFRSPTSPWRP